MIKARVINPLHQSYKITNRNLFIKRIVTSIFSIPYKEKLLQSAFLQNINKLKSGSTESPKPKVVFVSKNSVKINFTKPALEAKQDVEDYLAALKEQYGSILLKQKNFSLVS